MPATYLKSQVSESPVYAIGFSLGTAFTHPSPYPRAHVCMHLLFYYLLNPSHNPETNNVKSWSWPQKAHAPIKETNKCVIQHKMLFN